MTRELDLGPDPENLPPARQRKRRRMPADMRSTYDRFSGYPIPREAVRYAVSDIQKTLELHKDRPLTDPYVAKLLAEFDELVALGQFLDARKR